MVRQGIRHRIMISGTGKQKRFGRNDAGNVRIGRQGKKGKRIDDGSI